MIKVFSVEDNKEIQELLGFSLTGFGFEVKVFSSAEELFEYLESKKDYPDLILLDVMLPSMSGAEAIKALRAKPSMAQIPIVMLTAKNAEMDIVKALEDGADDYITKPFSVVELAARIKAHIRRKAKSQKIEEGGVIIDLTSREVFFNGELTHLTVKEFELLYALIKRPNSVIKREALLNDIWGYDYLGETRTLDMHIKTLRSKAKDAANIITIRGIGYKFIPSG